jgi:hypothetical protein
MYGQKRNSIIYASTCIVCSSVEYVYKNLFEMKRIKWKHKIKKNRVENIKWKRIEWKTQNKGLPTRTKGSSAPALDRSHVEAFSLCLCPTKNKDQGI